MLIAGCLDPLFRVEAYSLYSPHPTISLRYFFAIVPSLRGENYSALFRAFIFYQNERAGRNAGPM